MPQWEKGGKYTDTKGQHRWTKEEVHLFLMEIKAQLLDKKTHGYQN